MFRNVNGSTIDLLSKLSWIESTMMKNVPKQDFTIKRCVTDTIFVGNNPDNRSVITTTENFAADRQHVIPLKPNRSESKVYEDDDDDDDERNKDSDNCPTTVSQNAKIQLMRKVSMPRVDDMMTMATLIKYTRRLLFVLDELRQEMSAKHDRCCDAVTDLIHKIRLFYNDLKRTNAWDQQVDEFLEMYDCYRREYSCLRDQIECNGNGTEVGEFSRTLLPNVVEDSDELFVKSVMPSDGKQRSRTTRGIWSRSTGQQQEEITGNTVHECPGVFDVTKCKKHTTYDRNYDVYNLSSNFVHWIKYCLCLCFPVSDANVSCD